MTLHEKAYLVVGEDTSTTSGNAVFEMEIGKQQTSELNKSYIMGERGQYIREVVNQVALNEAGPDGNTADRRTGFWIDGGAGSWQETIEFETGLEATTWGDGSGGTGPANVTKTDASGEDVKKRSRADVFTYWMAATITDSNNPGLLYAGEWTDGRFEGEEGAFGKPMRVAVNDHNISTDVDRPSGLRGTVTVSHIQEFPDVEQIPDYLKNSTADFLESVGDALGVIPDE